MYFKTQKFLIAGMSKSGFAAAQLLLRKGAAKVYGYDQDSNQEIEKNFSFLMSKGMERAREETLPTVQKECDVLVLSPGVPIDHPLSVWFKKSGKRIIGEMELGALLLKSPSIAVTGTNGKTTTVGMITHLLNSAGKRAVACGNVGTPLCSVAEGLGFDDIAVIEVSSFQLETLSSLQPHVCVELNLSQDHLDRHYTMDNYVFLKEKLLQNSRESEVVILNADDNVVNRFAKRCRGKVIKFTLKDGIKGEGKYARASGGALYYGEEKIMDESELPLSGEHNVSNVLAAVCAVKQFGLTATQIKTGLTSFGGIRHRIETVATVNGVTYINDSKGTNVSATVKAIESVKGEIVLLAGGKDKGYSYDELFRAMKKSNKVVRAMLYGEAREKLISSALKEGFVAFSACDRLADAFQVASLCAKEGQSVLLSPASSSFDEFNNYEERGEYFCSLVKSLRKRRNRGASARPTSL